MYATNIEKLIENTVLFSPTNIFYQEILDNSLNPNRISKLVRRDKLRLVNSFSVVALSSNKNLLSLALSYSNIPMPTTVLGPCHDEAFWSKIQEEFKNSRYQPLIISKDFEKHCGEGIEVHVPDRRLLDESDKILQKFEYPSLEIFRDGYMRDTRMFIIDGKVAYAFMRRAPEPLIDPKTKQVIQYPPSKRRFLTNILQGGKKESVLPEIQDASFKVAEETCKIIIKQTQNSLDDKRINRLREKEVRLGYCSVDVIYDENGKPKVTEVDSFPGILSISDEKLFKSLASHLMESGVFSNFPKPRISVYGWLPVLDHLYEHLQNCELKIISPKSTKGKIES
jgi:glutathione synthase/RimK-type ligase-like ATP-grasp enzyme